MNRKNCTDECAPPHRTSHLVEYQKQQHDCDAVQDNICKMMATRAKSPKLTIQHVRYGCQRMPITGMLADKCADYPMSTQSACDRRVCVNVSIIIVVHELVANGLAKNQPCDGNEQNTNYSNWYARLSPWSVSTLLFAQPFRFQSKKLLMCGILEISAPYQKSEPSDIRVRSCDSQNRSARFAGN